MNQIIEATTVRLGNGVDFHSVGYMRELNKVHGHFIFKQCSPKLYARGPLKSSKNKQGF